MILGGILGSSKWIQSAGDQTPLELVTLLGIGVSRKREDNGTMICTQIRCIKACYRPWFKSTFSVLPNEPNMVLKSEGSLTLMDSIKQQSNTQGNSLKTRYSRIKTDISVKLCR